MQPEPKRKRFIFQDIVPFPSADVTIKSLFTGLDVEIFDKTSINCLFDSGCYGMNSKPRQAISYNEKKKKKAPEMTQIEYERKIQWKEKFGNSNEDDEIDPFAIPQSLVLFPEEAMFLNKEIKCLQVYDLDDKLISTENLWKLFCELKYNFVECYVSFLYLKSKNWVIKSGIKFGGNFRKQIN
jgi:tRNA-splicing endonuclease subunit Sen2